MTSSSFFTFQPKLRSYSIRPSEDHPTELMLIEEESGAALGINHEEKRVVELIDGERSLSDILKIVAQDEITRFSCVRRLLWDLDRFGFLHVSPWGVKWSLVGEGYWGGKQASSYSSFQFKPIIGSLETWLGRIIITPYFQGMGWALFLFALLSKYNLFYSETPFLIHQSVALALLVVIFAILGGYIFTSWFGVMMLRTLYPKPVRCAIDYRFGLPIFRLDGRRLRTLPWYRGLLCALAPVSTLLLMAGVSFLLAGKSEGLRREWLFHLACSWWVVCLLLVAPWISTLLSRDIMLRLRGESVFKIAMQAVRNAFRNLIQYTVGKDPYERMLFTWGIWTIIETLILLRLLTLSFRWNLPVLVNHFLQEENSYLLILLFSLFALGGATLVSVFITFFLWISREIYREMRSRFWPQRDHLIVSLLMAFLCLLSIRTLWGTEEYAPWLLENSIFIFGAILAALGIFSWWKEGNGFECWINFAFVFLGGWLILWGSVMERVLPTTQADNNFLLTEMDKPTISFSLGFVQGLGILIAAGILFYTIVLYGFRFEKPEWNFSMWLRRGAAPLITVILFIMLILKLPFQESGFGLTAQWLTLLLGITLIGGTAYRGSLRNHSTILCLSAVLLIFPAGYLKETFPFTHSIRTGMIAHGTLLAMGGILLRLSGNSKTALNMESLFRITALPTHNDIKVVYKRLLESARTLYGCLPKISKHADGDESLRRALYELYHFSGPRAMRAIVRRTILNLPWKMTRQLFSLLPVSVSVPRMTDWTEETISHRLQHVPTFAHIPHIERIEPYTRITLFDKHDPIIEQNEIGQYLFILVSGQVIVEEDTPWGRTVRAILHEGDFIGEIGFLSGERRTASVRALEPVLALCVHQEDVRFQLKKTHDILIETESGAFWLQQLERTQVCREFNPSLSTRVYLESQQITLYEGETLRLGKDDHPSEIAIFLAGKAVNVSNDHQKTLHPGSLVGLEACLDHRPYKGMIRAEATCQILIVDQSLFLEAITELLTPKDLLQYNH